MLGGYCVSTASYEIGADPDPVPYYCASTAILVDNQCVACRSNYYVISTQPTSCYRMCLLSPFSYIDKHVHQRVQSVLVQPLLVLLVTQITT